jgi:hypothetical protein
MNDETTNLVLEHLRRIRASQERMELDLGEMKSRVSALEQTTGQILNSIGTVNQRMDRFDERLSRIEKRLDLIEA